MIVKLIESCFNAGIMILAAAGHTEIEDIKDIKAGEMVMAKKRIHLKPLKK